jgi:site-specific recombinase XerC
MSTDLPETMAVWEERYLHHLMHERRLSPRTVESYSRDLHALLPWLEAEKILDFDDDSPVERRDRAIMELFYSSGLRLAELVALNLGVIDVNDGMVEVTGGGLRQSPSPGAQEKTRVISGPN